MNLFSTDLSRKQPVSLIEYNPDDLVVFNKKNHNFFDVMTLEEIDHAVETQGFDSRLFDIITYKQYLNRYDNNLCVLIIDNQRAELSSFDELIGVSIRL